MIPCDVKATGSWPSNHLGQILNILSRAFQPTRIMTALCPLWACSPRRSGLGCGFKSPRLHQIQKRRRPWTSFFVPEIQQIQEIQVQLGPMVSEHILQFVYSTWYSKPTVGIFWNTRSIGDHYGCPSHADLRRQG